MAKPFKAGRFRLVEDDSGDRVGWWLGIGMTNGTPRREEFVTNADVWNLARIFARAAQQLLDEKALKYRHKAKGAGK